MIEQLNIDCKKCGKLVSVSLDRTIVNKDNSLDIPFDCPECGTAIIVYYTSPYLTFPEIE